jgi:hypothetical protein
MLQSSEPSIFETALVFPSQTKIRTVLPEAEGLQEVLE